MKEIAKANKKLMEESKNSWTSSQF